MEENVKPKKYEFCPLSDNKPCNLYSKGPEKKRICLWFAGGKGVVVRHDGGQIMSSCPKLEKKPQVPKISTDPLIEFLNNHSDTIPIQMMWFYRRIVEQLGIIGKLKTEIDNLTDIQDLYAHKIGERIGETEKLLADHGGASYGTWKDWVTNTLEDITHIEIPGRLDEVEIMLGIHPENYYSGGSGPIGSPRSPYPYPYGTPHTTTVKENGFEAVAVEDIKTGQIVFVEIDKRTGSTTVRPQSSAKEVKNNAKNIAIPSMSELPGLGPD